MKNFIFTLMMVCFVFGTVNAQKRISFLHDPGVNAEQVGLEQALRDKGYTVDVSYTPFDFTALATYDLIIVSKGISSSDFVAADWNTVIKPVFVLSTFATRDSRMKLIQGTVVNPADGSLVDPNLITNGVPQANTNGSFDAVFNGVTTGAAFPYFKRSYNFLDYYLTDWKLDQNSGKPLVVLPDDASVGGGAVIMARWLPGVECYPGAGIHAGWRSFMDIGTDDDATPTTYNFDNYTPTSLKLFLNEVAFLMDPITGVRDLKNESQVKVYPNPSTDGRLTIKLKDSKIKKFNIQIYTITGMQVYNKYFETTGNISINSGLGKGMYLLVVSSDGNKSAQKIVIN